MKGGGAAMVKIPDIPRTKRQKERAKAKAEMSFARKWPFALIVGVLLGGLSMIDKGLVGTDSNLDSPCRVQVTAETLPTRSDADSGAGKVSELKRNQLVGATPTVRNGYRQLADGNWALSQYLQPLPPVENCTAK
jgi:hypothetical protein